MSDCCGAMQSTFAISGTPEKDAIVVFARLPKPGLVKTRLAASVGNDQAALFYKCCAETVIRELGRLTHTAIYLFYSRGEDEVQVAAWLAPLCVASMRFVPQLQHPDLGIRMEHALRHAFSQGHQRVAIVGSDVPDLSSTIVRTALSALDPFQAVFGPAEDGGYYLLALNTLPAGLFQGIQWSTSTVLAANMLNAQRLGLQVAPLHTLEMLPDIDTLHDLQKWCNKQQTSQAQQQQQQNSLLQVALHVTAAAGCDLGTE